MWWTGSLGEGSDGEGLVREAPLLLGTTLRNFGSSKDSLSWSWNRFLSATPTKLGGDDILGRLSSVDNDILCYLPDQSEDSKFDPGWNGLTVFCQIFNRSG